MRAGLAGDNRAVNSSGGLPETRDDLTIPQREAHFERAFFMLGYLA